MLFSSPDRLKTRKILELDDLPNLAAYWKLLKKRESYQKAILDFYGPKEKNDILSVFGENDSMHLKPLIEMVKNLKDH